MPPTRTSINQSRITHQSNLKRKLPTSKLKPRSRPKKALLEASAPTLTHTADDNPTEVPSTEKPVTGETNTAMSATEVSSKIYKPSNHNETISDLIYGRQWGEAIEEELQNLEQHNTWEYFKLSSKRVAIGSKWVFKVKYHPDGSVDIRRVIQ